jgi:hypothetical protein
MEMTLISYGTRQNVGEHIFQENSNSNSNTQVFVSNENNNGN